MTIALTYAMALGVLAAVNPCGFPLLPAYLAFFASSDSGSVVQRLAAGLRAGLLVTLGFVAAFGLAGILIEAGLPLVVAWIPWAMIVVGLALAAVGVVTLIRGHLSIRFPHVPLRSGRSTLTMIGFGITYAVASLSCSLPLFLAGVAGAFTRESISMGLANFLAYAVGMGVFVTIASVVAALVGTAALKGMRSLSRFAPRIAAGIAVIVGLYLAYYWITDLTQPLSTPPLTAFVNTVQTAIADWVSEGGLALIAILIAATMAVVIVVMVARRPRASASVPASVPDAQEHPEIV
jgi:cytochrome c-type biogenesis protein